MRADERGTTLLELSVVVAVLAILVAVMIPTLLGAHTHASDAAAKSLARHAATVQRVHLSDNAGFADAAALRVDDPSLRAAPLDPSAALLSGTVYVDVSGAVATLVSRSASGTCYWVRQPADGAETFASAACPSTPPTTAFTTSW